MDNPVQYVDPNGESATVAGAVGGAVVGGAIAWWRGESVWKGAAAGAVAGAIAGSVIDTAGTSLAVIAVAGAAGSVSGGVVDRALHGQETTVGDIAQDALIGAATSFVAGPAASRAAATASSAKSRAVKLLLGLEKSQ